MIQRLLFAAVILSITSLTPFAQNTNSSQTVRPRVTAPTNSSKATQPQKSTDVQEPATTQPAAKRTETKPKIATSDTPGSQSVVAAFNALINGIRHIDSKAVNGVYWNSPRLIMFNYNGSVTKGWEQMSKNRESYYRDLKDVTLEVRDISISMLGRDGAVVSCLYRQSQTFKGAPESISGRMTLVFKRVGKDWKAIHLHTSTDKPLGIPPSEQTISPTPTSTP